MESKTILVFGDSIVSDEQLDFDNWVTKLRKFMNEKEENSVFNLGICGETSRGLLERMDVECKAREPDVIIIRTGGNDSRYNNKIEDSVETSIDKFEENIMKIIKICKKYSNKIIWVGEIPCDESKTMPTIWSPTEYFTNKSIKKYNDAIKEICKKEKVLFLELFDEWIKKDYKKWLDGEDGMHPNPKGYEIIFKGVRDFLIRQKII
ncbi:MAG: SGNH/GDSL hydrolase family protein [Candidatus Pacearchaeota archaeon]|nr:MAG: SGNH/GDSL hydrolase family protein [Candidatus Pacearchaeota archaeon]